MTKKTNPTTHPRDRDDRTVTTGRTMREQSVGRLAHLNELDDYKVADGEPDIRGWTVKSADGREIGEVEDLLVDCGAMEVRYLEVELDRKALDLDDDRHVLVPVGAARLNDDDDVVTLSRQGTEVAGLPAYTRDRVSPERERDLHERYAGTAAAAGRADAGKQDALYGDDRFDSGRFFGGRRRARDGATYLTRSEEQLAVGKREVERGAVTAHKRVETEHVRKSVPVTREEAHVERRPIAEGERATRGSAPRITEDEVRVPLMAEEVVAEKRVVPTEELVIRKETVRDQKTVEADLRRERIDVDGASARRAPGGTEHDRR